MYKTPVGAGVITNYNCTASCRHCMFASSPQCKKEYMTDETAEKTAALLRESGAWSVHIGGGEPFMSFDSLCTLIAALKKNGIAIDYIETNGYWCRDEDFARARLEKLKSLGADSVMVSVDPFHIEYVPLERVLLLCNLLDEYGFEYFIWQRRFLDRLLKLDITKTHTKQELINLLGDDYVTQTAKEYGLGINGRALAFASSLYENKPVSVLLSKNPCPSLSRPNHCHFDLYGNAVPSRCTGIQAKSEDYLSGNISPETYPVFSALKNGGTMALYGYAVSKGFIPKKEGYPTPCALCFNMRLYLYKNAPGDDLGPASFYDEMEKVM